MRSGIFWLLVIVATCPAASVLSQEQRSPELLEAIKVLQGLRQRRLFDLADLYAEQQLTNGVIEQNEKSAIYLEKIQTQVAAAIVATGQEREAAWDAAHQVQKTFDKRLPGHPQRLLITVQDALVYFSQGNLIRQEIAAEIAPESLKDKALAQFRAATTAFGEIEREIEKQLPIARSRNNNGGHLTALQLTNLKNNIRYRLATINLAKAQLYEPSDKLNHIYALTQVLERLEQVTTQSNPDLPLWWDAQIATATCFRLQKDATSIRKWFGSLPDSELSEELKAKILTEQILTAIDFNQRGQFELLLKKFSVIDAPNPELQLAGLRMMMAQAADAEGDQKRSKLAAATQLVKVIEATQGQYWARRAEVLLVGSVKVGGGQPVASSDFEILVRQGQAAFRKQNFNDAAKAFDKALAYAIGQDSAEQALQLAVRFAQCHESQKQHAIAGEKLLTVAQQFREGKLADVIHLRGCWNLAKVPDSQPTMLEALRTQAEIWPDSPDTDQARLWLGSAYQRASQWQRAFDAYNSISFASPHCISGIDQLETCASSLLKQARDNGNNPQPLARQLTDAVGDRLGLEASQSGNPNSAGDVQNWNGAQRSLLIAVLAIGLPNKTISADRAIELLDMAGRASDLSEQWRTQSRQIKLVAASLTPSDLDPLEVIRSLPNDAAIMLRCYQRLKNTLSAKQFDSVAAARVMICDKALIDKTVADKEFWEIERLVAQVASSDSASATQALKDYAAKYPKSLKVQLTYARALSQMAQDSQSTQNSLDRSEVLAQWRRVASRVRPESDAWFEAKHNLIDQLIQDGQQAEAEKLLRFLKVTVPTWDQSPWAARSQSLFK